MVTITEAALLTGRSGDLVRRWVATGRIPSTRTPGGYLLSDEALFLIRDQPRVKRRRTAP